MQPKDGKPGFVVMLCSRQPGLWTSRSLDAIGSAWEPLHLQTQPHNESQGLSTPGPTPGVVLPSGRLVAAAYGEVMFSDDDGRTWTGSKTISKGPGRNGSMPWGGEGEVAIAPNGSLIVNYRGGHPYTH